MLRAYRRGDLGQNVAMTRAAKQQLRTDLLAARAARSPAQIEAARAAIRATVLARQSSEGWRCVAGYLPLRTEPGSLALLAGLAARDVRVLVPRLLPSRDLDWVQWEPEAPGPVDPMSPPGEPLGTDAIAAADITLVPALAVTRDGIRLGRGGGSYDRALARARPAAQLVALLYDDEVLDRLPRDPWDVSVTAAVTPAGWQVFPDTGGNGRRQPTR
jgi:5-formyltetrahydrofolate cyclo-ligase